VGRESLCQLLTQLLAEAGSARTKLLPFQQIEGGQPGPHRQAIFAVGRGVYEGAFE